MNNQTLWTAGSDEKFLVGEPGNETGMLVTKETSAVLNRTGRRRPLISFSISFGRTNLPRRAVFYAT